MFYAADYGAVFDFVYGTGGTDNFQPIQDALDAAAAYGPSGSGNYGAVVQLPAGQGMLAFDSGTLTVSEGVWLRGYGPGATLIYRYGPTHPDSNTNPVVEMDTSNRMAKVSDFALACQVGTNQAHGIVMRAGQQALGVLGGYIAEVQRIVMQVQGTGFVVEGIEDRVIDCYVRSAKSYGFDVSGTDNFLYNCTADTCLLTGFRLQSSNSKLSNCKAFGGGASGFVVNGNRNMLATCEAQDNAEAGFIAVQQDNVLVGCVADTNGLNSSNPGDPTTLTGFVLNSSSASGCAAMNRSGTSQKYGYMLQKTGATDPMVFGTSVSPGTAHVWPSSVGSITVNGLGGSQSVAYAASITPDPYIGGTVIVGTLTNTLTVNAVASAGLFTGMRVAFQFTQDGSGHAVTLNSQYKTSAAISTTASSVTRIQFEYDGTNFREISRAVT